MYGDYDTDKEMTLLKIVDPSLNKSDNVKVEDPLNENDNKKIKDPLKNKYVDNDNAQGQRVRACISWFAVHCTSVNNKNQLINGDNKGVASMLLESTMRAQSGALLMGTQNTSKADMGSGNKMEMYTIGKDKIPPQMENDKVSPQKEKNAIGNNTMGKNKTGKNKGEFIGAFAQASVGDTSPNIMGAYCMDTGLPCDPLHSTCNGRNELCIGRGPGMWRDVYSLCAA